MLLQPAVAGTLVQVHADRQIGTVTPADITSAETSALVEALSTPALSSAAAVAAEAPAVAAEAHAAAFAVEAEAPAMRDSTPSQGRIVVAAEAPAVAAVAPAVAAEISRRSIGVGEHVSGEPFLWRGIWDMP